jgi:hypothetical protein
MGAFLRVDFGAGLTHEKSIFIDLQSLVILSKFSDTKFFWNFYIVL